MKKKKKKHEVRKRRRKGNTWAARSSFFHLLLILAIDFEKCIKGVSSSSFLQRFDRWYWKHFVSITNLILQSPTNRFGRLLNIFFCVSKTFGRRWMTIMKSWRSERTREQLLCVLVYLPIFQTQRSNSFTIIFPSYSSSLCFAQLLSIFKNFRMSWLLCWCFGSTFFFSSFSLFSFSFFSFLSIFSRSFSITADFSELYKEKCKYEVFRSLPLPVPILGLSLFLFLFIPLSLSSYFYSSSSSLSSSSYSIPPPPPLCSSSSTCARGDILEAGPLTSAVLSGERTFNPLPAPRRTPSTRFAWSSARSKKRRIRRKKKKKGKKDKKTQEARGKKKKEEEF